MCTLRPSVHHTHQLRQGMTMIVFNEVRVVVKGREPVSRES
jgi:hypothetical protein